uniref:Aspartyl/asparaginy/proline hydroxylase domain-containing protein n=1 Tax=Alexandrium monilatum TaxID=311494 RepID=A0A7S4PTA1_9DINO
MTGAAGAGCGRGRPPPLRWRLGALAPLLAAAGGAAAAGAPAAAGGESPLQIALRALGGQGRGAEVLSELRKLRNSRSVLQDVDALYSVTGAVEQAMREAYEGGSGATANEFHEDQNASAAPRGTEARRRPGNFHGVKSHSYYVGAISEAHPSMPLQAVQSIVASEWYHPGLTAKAVWCTRDCGAAGFPLARRLDENFAAIRREVDAFWRDPAAAAELRGVGSHTTQFDRLIAGNGTWVDVRLWRGRAFNRRLCERHFRVICAIVEASPEIWTNPWSHVLLSVLLHDSWVPFHQGHTNGQLTYHLPVRVPRAGGAAELAVVDRGGTLADDKAFRGAIFSHPEERTVTWTEGRTLVFDDSFTHAVRFRSVPVVGESAPPAADPAVSGTGKSVRSSPGPAVGAASASGRTDDARIVLLMRGWHPEMTSKEREALREFIRRGGEEDPEGYEMLPISSSAFQL